MKELFIVSHPDDESYGPYGTIANLIKNKKEVIVFCLCDGSRPSNEKVSKNRIASFVKNCEKIGAEYIIGNNLDLRLDIIKITDEIEKVVNHYKPSTIYTHSMSDINRDHRLTAEASLVAARPKLNSSVKEFYFFEVPSSSDWSFNKFFPQFQPNYYVEITKEVLDLKVEALSNYKTEIYESPDARSLESVITLSKYRGFQVGFNYAEAFQLVFSRNQNNHVPYI